MSVINQMLRELDARGGTPAQLPVTAVRPLGAKGRHAGLILGGMALLAAAAAGYWMRHPVPVTDASQHAPATARQQAVAVSIAPAATAAATQPVPLPAAAASGPTIGASRQPPGREPSREDALQAPRQALSAPPAPIPSLQGQDRETPAGDPAVVKMTALSPEAEAQQLLDEAQVLRRGGKIEAAMGTYRQALERYPGMTGARLQLAGLLQETGQADAALSLLAAGFEQRADDRLAIAAARLLADQGQREAALAWLQRGQTGLRAADHALMGALLSQAHRHAEASEAYRRALAADPGHGGWQLGLGLALEAQGRHDDAQAAYRTALERGQFKPEVMQFLRERSGLSGP